jgi:hypothetical protein
MQTVEQLELETSYFEVEIAIENKKNFKTSGIYKILAELIQARCSILRSEIHKLINSICNNEDLLQQ